MRRFSRLLSAIVVGVGSSVGFVSEQAGACCSYVWWYQPGTRSVFRNLVGFDHVITPIESTGNRMNYWATQWTWTDSPEGGYTGVQTAGVREDEGPNPGPVALFSLWGASSAIPGPNARCRPFDWEGVGILCRIDLPTVLTANSIRVLDPEISYLNHGSFGAVPKVVAAAQRKFQALEESNPNLFFRTTLPKLHDEARSFVAGWLGVAPELFAFVPNNNRTLVVLN